MNSALIYSFISYYLVLVLIFIFFTKSISNKSVANSISILLPVFILAIPVNELPGLYYIRGAFGDLSILTSSLVTVALLGKFFKFKFLETESTQALYIFIFILGLLFYVTSLGVGKFDLYVLGYSQTAVPMILLTLSLLRFLKDEFNLGFLLVLPVLIFNTGLLESNNVWDYALDPFLWIYSIAKVFTCLSVLRKNKKIA